MKGARVTSWGASPKYIDVPVLPDPSPEQRRLRVVAVGVPRAVQGRAARKHPSAHEAALPYDPSVDGVGRDEDTGDLYFINSLAAPLFAEYTNVDRDQTFKLEPGSDPVAVAALANNAASSWMALQCRVVGGCKGRTVAILGATSASGRSAARVAKFLGAERVIGISRTEEKLVRVEGLDERVILQDPLVLPENLGPIDIVLDFVGGPAAIELLKGAQIRPGENLQYVQTGGLAGHDTLVVPSRLINVKPIRIMASGVGSLSMEDLQREMPGVVSAITRIKTPPFDVFTAPLSDVEKVWNTDDAKNKRLVLLP